MVVVSISVSCHACYDCAMFKTYVTNENKKVLLESSYTTKVVENGDMKLQFMSEKKVILYVMMQALKIRKNLGYQFILNKTEFTQV